MKIPHFLILFLLCSFNLVTADIVINEIMYNSPGTDVEFIELYNNSETDINLNNWYILDDNNEHIPCYLTDTLKSGDYLVIVEDTSLFKNKYPDVANMHTNPYNQDGSRWSLGNGGDVVRLFNQDALLVDSVAYEDDNLWPGSPDGNGPSLELIHPALNNAIPTSWDPSLLDGGTPGAINSAYASDVVPVCKDGYRKIDLPNNSDEVPVNVLAFDQEGLERVELFVDFGEGYQSQLMYDDGLHEDGAAGDSIYGSIIPASASGTLVKYYAMATDTLGQQDAWPNNPPQDYRAYTVDYRVPKLRITEVLAVNDSVIADEFGEFDDWFEIHNEDSIPVNLEGMYVSNSLMDTRAFPLSNYLLEPNDYVIIWADDDKQGIFHANFKLSAKGEEVALFESIDHGNVLIHGWQFGRMSPDVSMGFFPDSGMAPEYLVDPTPGASNDSSQLFSPVCINEFHTKSTLGGYDDWIEIYNRGNAPFDLSGCFISDESVDNVKWAFAENTIIDPGEFKVVYEDVLELGFASSGDEVIMLTAADSTTGLDFLDYSEQLANHSTGRFPDGANNWIVFEEPTPNETNIIKTGLDALDIANSKKFILSQNYPNPFNHETQIEYQLPKTEDIKITIYDINGRQIKKLYIQNESTGHHTFKWNGMNQQGHVVSSGIYFFSVQAGAREKSIKMLLIK